MEHKVFIERVKEIVNSGEELDLQVYIILAIAIEFLFESIVPVSNWEKRDESSNRVDSEGV